MRTFLIKQEISQNRDLAEKAYSGIDRNMIEIIVSQHDNVYAEQEWFEWKSQFMYKAEPFIEILKYLISFLLSIAGCFLVKKCSKKGKHAY